ncbi:Sec7 [Geosmithia morbida]|uniref:Sec7 n=1 Tax=Geosmithia morbida TaxID=1094350 RepID=A0A9P4YU83_9HYPO|nr:Sec7 [Geosmithia morbida]KAF4121783.1 Sec7 [Geosmithia morbida]
MPLLRRRGNTPSEPNIQEYEDSAQDPVGCEDVGSPPPQSETSVDNDDAAAATSTDPQSRASTVNLPETPPAQEDTNRHKRFSLLRFRNASDPQLSLRAKQQAEKPPPIPRPPEIITTAPTGELQGPKKKSSRMSLVAARLRVSSEFSREHIESPDLSNSHRQPRKSLAEQRARPTLATLEEPLPLPSLQPTAGTNANPSTTPATLTNRQSESSRSDASSNDRLSHQSPATTPRKSPSSNPFFKMRRAKKSPEPMFPLSHLPQKDKTPFASQASLPGTSNQTTTPRPSSVRSSNVSRTPTDRAGPSPAAALFSHGGGGSRSGQSSPTRPSFLRGRSSTMSSLGGGRDSADEHHLAPTTRTSSSTGRKSFGDLLGLTRLRQNSELSRQGTMTPTTPASAASQSNSFQIARDSISLPEKREDESAAKYLSRVEEIFKRGVIAAALSKHSDPFSAAVLRSYMRSFSFFEDPMDMAIRKLLMEAELPKETQQIDRYLQAFANRYHECNPGIYTSPDQAYFIAFSLLILHTDVFNKNNKYKMQKPDYLKNTQGEGVFDDVLECFYDNISYTPFIHVEDELDAAGERASIKNKRKNILAGANDPAKRAVKEPIDPYTLIIDGNLDALRPNLKEILPLEDHYNYLGTATSLDLRNLQETFFRTGVLQIVSARSRPDAFMTEKTATNPEDAGPGIVDIKITKVGLLWRKDPKKRRTRSPWQEWGAILTGAQLYFFRNTGWVKSLMHQRENHVKAGNDGVPIIFKPPLEHFKPDALMSTHGAVALHDTSYKKHKNAFVYVRQGGLDEVLLADDEDELNDWLAKLNYAAAFRTSGVRMRGVLGANYDGQGRRGMRRLDGAEAEALIDTPSGQVSVVRGRINHQEAEDIQTARRAFMCQKIEETEENIKVSQKKLDDQLRNARHLMILAPIQPRTREQVLASAVNLSARIKWSRVEIWREKCHRDILSKDLDEDNPSPLSRASPLISDLNMSSRERPSSPTRSTSRHTSKLAASRSSEKAPEVPGGLHIAVPSEHDEASAESPGDAKFETPPQSAVEPNGDRRESRDGSTTEGDGSTTADTTTASAPGSPLPLRRGSVVADAGRRASKSSENQDDVDADEREFLQQAGLVEHRADLDSEKGTVSTSVDGGDFGSPVDRTKIRRSLQRTLREGAGHLSHHRSSRRGREGQSIGPTEDTVSESSVLPRSTGSFVVHGKKASVINFGSELHYVPTEEKMRGRKSMPSTELHQPLSPALSAGDDDDFYSATGDPEEEEHSRRESAASASTATARSFRELHRKFSANNARRSVSNNGAGRLTIPSDGESEAAVSFSEGRRSPLPPMQTEEDEGGDGNEAAVGDDGETSSTTPPSKKEVKKKTSLLAEGESSVEELQVQHSTDRPPSQDTATLESRSLQPVNA